MIDPFVLTGTRRVERPPARLTAGPLTADLIDGNLRSIRHKGIEILRAIAYIVRDRDWGTYQPEISNLSIQQGSEAFGVTYTGKCVGAGGSTLVFKVTIKGSADGLIFEVTATPTTDFETNRCGFCILHPIVGLAATPVMVEHVDGSKVDTKLPDLIDPWQPLKNLRAITHRVSPGLKAECRMEGDAFEMEDQRNWSDASYKTYVRPLELPWPYLMPGGVEQTQKVTCRISAIGKASQHGHADAPTHVEPADDGPAMPAIAVVVYPEDVAETIEQISVLRDVKPQGLLLHFDPTKGHGPAEFEAFAALCKVYAASTTLECALPCRREPHTELDEIAQWVRQAGLKLDALVVSPSVDRQSTPPGSKWPECPPLEDVYTAARVAFPNVLLGGGMLSYFTELNRKRVPTSQIDFVTHCTCPIVHASDDLSVMQSLEALPFIVRSVRAIFSDKPYRIGPSTIAMRQNPYGSATKENPELVRIAMANRDPRHNALFAAAWAIGYAAQAVSADLDQLTLSSVAGPFGLIAGPDEPSAIGSLRPLAHVIKALASMAGWRRQVVQIGETSLAVLRAQSGEGETAALLANLAPSVVAVDVSALGSGDVELLDEQAVATLGAWRKVAIVNQKLDLPAYTVARLGGKV